MFFIGTQCSNEQICLEGNEDLLSSNERATWATSSMSHDRSTSTSRRMSNSCPAASRHASSAR